MNPRNLKNNQELLAYLVILGERLKNGNQMDLASVVLHASRFVRGSASEFFHEAQLALEQVMNRRPDLLTADEKADLESVIGQIKDAFRKVGGA